MTNYYKRSNYYIFCAKMFIVTAAIMSDNGEKKIMLYYIPEVFRRLANKIHGHICVTLE